MTSLLPSRRTLRALDLMTVLPKLTWPSPAITTWPCLRTERIVVPCQGPRPWEEAEEGSDMGSHIGIPGDPGKQGLGRGRRLASGAKGGMLLQPCRIFGMDAMRRAEI